MCIRVLARGGVCLGQTRGKHSVSRLVTAVASRGISYFGLWLQLMH